MLSLYPSYHPATTRFHPLWALLILSSTSRRWQDQAQRRLGSCSLQVVDVACRLGLLQSMLGLSQGPQDAASTPGGKWGPQDAGRASGLFSTCWKGPWKKPLVMRCQQTNKDGAPPPKNPMNSDEELPWETRQKRPRKNDPIGGSKCCAFRIQSLLAWNCAHKNQQKSPVQVSHCMGVARTTPPHVMSQIPSCTSLRGSNWT